MPTIYPKHTFKIMEAVDVDYVNENFQEVVSAVQGSLGEQNWSKDSFVDADLNADALGQVNNTYKEVARTFKDASGVGRNGFYEAVGYEGFSRWTKIPTDRRWYTLSEMEITTRDCLLWVIASWQQDYNSGSKRDQDFPGVQYSLAIDGTRIAESTIGGMDRANDTRGEANAVWKHAFATDAFINVSNGTHTISLQARMVPTHKYTAYDSNSEYYLAATRELIALEIT
tara:strand:+ start:520 stop:1203 length:684 start_codon:yes stop_codon:yes gene_type:complete